MGTGKIGAAAAATNEEGRMTSITEIAPDVFRISIFVPEIAAVPFGGLMRYRSL
jgi:hypothetical protein